jgi:hypothetical protein
MHRAQLVLLMFIARFFFARCFVLHHYQNKLTVSMHAEAKNLLLSCKLAHATIENSPTDATSRKRNLLICWLECFPFCSTLPIQPLTFERTYNGVDIAFRRKKTDEKSGKDGGVRLTFREDAHEIIFEANRDVEGQSISKV